MVKVAVLSGLLFSLLTLQARANFFSTNSKLSSRECTKIDLRSDLGEVRDQGNVGWCFANSAADLVTYKLKKRISPVDMAINFYDKMPQMPRTDKLSSASGGNVQGALSYSSAGFCEEDLIASENFQIDKKCLSSAQPELSSIIIFMENLFDKNPMSLSYCQKNIITSLFKNISESDLNQVASLFQKTSLEKISLLKDLNCKKRRISANGIIMRGGYSNDDLIDIDEQLNNSNPISINYNAYFLLKESIQNQMYNHYSNIVGRRKAANSCQYLIRNSWGKDCSIYPSPYNTQCENGNIWVDEDVLRQYIIGIYFLKK